MLGVRTNERARRGAPIGQHCGRMQHCASPPPLSATDRCGRLARRNLLVGVRVELRQHALLGDIRTLDRPCAHRRVHLKIAVDADAVARGECGIHPSGDCSTAALAKGLDDRTIDEDVEVE